MGGVFGCCTADRLKAGDENEVIIERHIDTEIEPVKRRLLTTIREQGFEEDEKSKITGSRYAVLNSYQKDFTV